VDINISIVVYTFAYVQVFVLDFFLCIITCYAHVSMNCTTSKKYVIFAFLLVYSFYTIFLLYVMCMYVTTDGSNMPVSQLAGQSSDWPANHLNMYGKVTYGQMIGRQLADWHI